MYIFRLIKVIKVPMDVAKLGDKIEFVLFGFINSDRFTRSLSRSQLKRSNKFALGKSSPGHQARGSVVSYGLIISQNFIVRTRRLFLYFLPHPRRTRKRMRSTDSSLVPLCLW